MNEEAPELEPVEVEYSVDLENLPKQNHIWVRRGVVLSCEGAGHTSHRHFLVPKS